MIMMTDDWNDNDNNVDHNDDNDDNVTASAMVTMINKMVIIPPAKPRQPVYTENLESQPPQLPKTKSRFDLRDQKKSVPTAERLHRYSLRENPIPSKKYQ